MNYIRQFYNIAKIPACIGLMMLLPKSSYCDSYNYKQKEDHNFQKKEATIVKYKKSENQKYNQDQNLNNNHAEKEAQLEKLLKNHKYKNNFSQLYELGIRKTNIIYALDFTRSSHGLHIRHNNNPYADLISIFSEVMNGFKGVDNFVSFSFGKSSCDCYSSNLHSYIESDINMICTENECKSYAHFLQKYKESVSHGVNGWNSCFTNSLVKSYNEIYKKNEHTVLIIITDAIFDSHVKSRRCYERILDKMSTHPISIIVICVVDKEYTYSYMNDLEFLNDLSQKYHNFNYIDYHQITTSIPDHKRSEKVAELYTQIVSKNYKEFIKKNIIIAST